MRSAMLFGLAVGGTSERPIATGKTVVNDPNLIAYYNSVNGATWVAGHNDFFNGMTFDDARPIMGTALTNIVEHLNSTLPASTYNSSSEAPSDFDATKKWSGLIHPIRNQKHCGSCWAFSASEVMGDRVAVASGAASPVLSPEDMVSCDKADMGCKGGRLGSAWSYIKDTGLLTDACFPYTAGSGIAPACQTKCVDGSPFTRVHAGSVFAIDGVGNMQKEIMTNGPIQVAFQVYKSFMSYKSGVYSKHWWEFLPEGGHAVKAVGWGTQYGTDYWRVANSWGTTEWGDMGYFNIKRGSNECGIETMGPPYAGLPAKSPSPTPAHTTTPPLHPTPAPGQCTTAEHKSNWAVIVAGSSGYGNYRHQADACHAYQIMREKGIPESNIILMMADDVANNNMNPFPGQLFNKPTADGVPGKDVYKGCKVDYSGSDVTPENFVKVLTGAGSGKVLKSTSADNVFVNFVDHGGVGLIGFPRSTLHKEELTGALKTMKEKDMFNRLVFYLEACESGSMFEGMNIPGVYGLTAANGHESSWGTYCMPNDKVNGKHIGSCLGDAFSVNWMEDLDMDTGVTEETLGKQFTVVKSETSKSHVMQFSDLSFQTECVSDFVGKDAALSYTLPARDSVTKDFVSVRELHMHNLYHVYESASTSAERLVAGDALKAQLAEQEAAETTFRRLAELSYPGDKAKQMAVRRLQESPKNLACEKGTHLALRSCCAGKFDAGSGFAMQFQQVIVNICADVERALHFELPAIACQACTDGTAIVV